jgi:hypothetical protein
MKKWIVPAIISAFALSLFEMGVAPLPISEHTIESGRLPPNQEKTAIRLAQLLSFIPFNLVPGINLLFSSSWFYGQEFAKQNQLSQSDVQEADSTARGTAGIETLLGFFVWLGTWAIVALLRPKWFYIGIAFVLTVAATIWISQL